MANEVNIFKFSDFEKWDVETSYPRTMADLCNKLLAERMVKYYLNHDPKDEWITVSRDPEDADTHIIYGLEPQPIIKEKVKKEITREELAKAWDKHCVITEKYNQSDSSPTFKDFCKELGL